MCASPEGGLSVGEAQVILTRLKPLVLPGTATRKKSRIVWNTEKEKPLQFSSVDLSQGCDTGLLGLWTLNYLEYPTTSNALMKRVRLIKSQPEIAQPPISGSQASSECEENSVPSSPAPRGIETRANDKKVKDSMIAEYRKRLHKI